MKRVVMVLAVLALALVGWVAYELYAIQFAHAAPDEWRTFARETTGPELEVLASDYTRRDIERFKQFCVALERCDEEAFQTAERLYPLIRMAAHSSEEFYTAVSASLSVCPQRTFELTHKVGMTLRTVCDWSDSAARTAVNALLDSGLDESVRECLAAMDERDGVVNPAPLPPGQ